MEQDKYIGMDVHSSTTVVNARDAFGKVVLEGIVATKAEAILQCNKVVILQQAAGRAELNAVEAPTGSGHRVIEPQSFKHLQGIGRHPDALTDGPVLRGSFVDLGVHALTT